MWQNMMLCLMDIMEILKMYRKEIDGAIEKIIPREYDEKSMKKTFGDARYKFDPYAATEAISKPFWDLLDRGGKRWRPVLFMLILEALGKKAEKFIELAATFEIIHNGTLMIDDIEDDSDLRRGEPCTHKKFGLDISINAGNAIYFLPMLVIRETDLNKGIKNKLYETYIQEMTNISLGQGMDIVWHKGLGKVSEKTYLQMCAFKTGTLARMSAKFAAILAGLDEGKIEKIGKSAEAIGVAFQIQDDILNITGSKDWGKGYGDDVTEGKRSFMVVRTLDIADEADREKLLSILNRHSKEKKLIDEAIEILKKYNSVEYAKNVARKIVSEAWEDVKDLFMDNDSKTKLEVFVNFMVERDI